MIHEWAFTDGTVSGIREWIWDQAADVDFWATSSMPVAHRCLRRGGAWR
jgi:hypothetical protein